MSSAERSAPFDHPIPGFDAVRMSQYERGTANRGPRDLLVRWLPEIEPLSIGRSALDLGCGVGQETDLLLERGWSVIATDASRRMIETTRARAARIGAASRLTLIHAPFERTEFEPSSFDLVHAGFSLPFAPVVHFDALWGTIQASIRPGGFFVGQLFGPNDSFVQSSPAGAISVQSAAAVLTLLANFEILHHEEIDRDGETAAGESKHWHVHHLCARRRTLS